MRLISLGSTTSPPSNPIFTPSRILLSMLVTDYHYSLHHNKHCSFGIYLILQQKSTWVCFITFGTASCVRIRFTTSTDSTLYHHYHTPTHSLHFFLPSWTISFPNLDMSSSTLKKSSLTILSASLVINLSVSLIAAGTLWTSLPIHHGLHVLPRTFIQ